MTSALERARDVSVRPDDPRCTLPASQVALLLSRGAQVEARTWADRTALHCAATNGRLGACKALVVGGAKLQARDKGGDTPVDAANCASQDVCCKAPNADWGALIALIEKVIASQSCPTNCFLVASQSSSNSRSQASHQCPKYVPTGSQMPSICLLARRDCSPLAGGADGRRRGSRLRAALV